MLHGAGLGAGKELKLNRKGPAAASWGSNPALTLAKLFPRRFILQQANPLAVPAGFPALGLLLLGVGSYF